MTKTGRTRNKSKCQIQQKKCEKQNDSKNLLHKFRRCAVCSSMCVHACTYTYVCLSVSMCWVPSVRKHNMLQGQRAEHKNSNKGSKNCASGIAQFVRHSQTPVVRVSATVCRVLTWMCYGKTQK